MNITKNFIYNLMYQVLFITMPIITVPYISRVLGKDGIGKNAYTNTYAQYFILLGMVGLAMYSNRQIAYVRDDKIKLKETFWELSILKFITVGISLILYIIIFVVINKQDRYIYLIQGLNIFAAAVDISWFFIGMEDFKKMVTSNMITKIIGVILIFLLVKRRDQVWLYILIIALNQLLSQLIMWNYIPKLDSFKKISINNLKQHLRSSFKLFVPQLAIQIYTMIDKIILGLLKGDAEVGIYDNSQKIIIISLSLLTSLSTVMMPFMSNAFANGNMYEFKERIKKSFSFVSFISIPMALGIVAIARSFVPWFFGNEFAQVEYILYIEVWMMIPIAWSSVLGVQVMIPMKKERHYTISVTVAALINLALNLVLIPSFKSSGAAFSTVAAECVVTIIQLYLLRDLIKAKDLFKNIYKYVIGSILMLVIIKCLDRFLIARLLSTFVEIILGIIVYFVMMLLLKDENLKYIIYKVRLSVSIVKNRTLKKF